jgi:hypothetical protein
MRKRWMGFLFGGRLISQQVVQLKLISPPTKSLFLIFQPSVQCRWLYRTIHVAIKSNWKIIVAFLLHSHTLLNSMILPPQPAGCVTGTPLLFPL